MDFYETRNCRDIRRLETSHSTMIILPQRDQLHARSLPERKRERSIFTARNSVRFIIGAMRRSWKDIQEARLNLVNKFVGDDDKVLQSCRIN